MRNIKSFFKVPLVVCLTLWVSASMGISCNNFVVNKDINLLPGQYLIGGVKRTVSVVNKQNLARYIRENGMQRTIEARMDQDALPLATNRLRHLTLNAMLKGLNRISTRFTDFQIFKKFVEFEAPEDGILRTADIMKIGRELKDRGISQDDIGDYEILIGRMNFRGSDFRALLKEARTKGELLKVDVDFGFKSVVANGLSFLYQWYPKAWWMGFYGGFITDYNQTFVDLSITSLGVYLISAGVGSNLTVNSNGVRNRYFKPFLYLPSFGAISETKNFNFLKLQRAKVAVENIERAALRAYDWESILIVVDDGSQADLVTSELQNRFN